MKQLKILIPLLIIFMVMTACQKENIIEDQADVIAQVDQVEYESANSAEVRKKKHLVPFHASFISTEDFFGPDPICGGGPLLTQTLTGNATHMGKISGSLSFCLFLGSGGATLVAANGDELNLVLIDPVNSILDIDGGTGRFEDATGCVTSDFVLIGGDPSVHPWVFSNDMNGVIQY